MKSPKYHLYLTGKEYTQIINALVELKNELISEGRYTDAVENSARRERKISKSYIRTDYLTVCFSTGSFFMPILDSSTINRYT